MKVGVINTASANLNSVCQALKRLKCEVIISDEVSVLKNQDKLILPGVGTAVAAMSVFNEKADLLDFVLNTKKDVLGICLGMQIMTTESYESADNSAIKTLNIIKGTVKKLDVPKVPHMGWNQITHNNHPIFKDIANNSFFYFVHSFAVDVNENTIAKCNYDVDFSAAVAKDNFIGVQFHPEKSGPLGRKLLNNFLNL